MNTESKSSRALSNDGLQRAILLQLLRDDHERMWSRAQLAIELASELDTELAEVGRQTLEEALRRLEREGVVGVSEQQAWASDAARRIDELGLIAV